LVKYKWGVTSKNISMKKSSQAKIKGGYGAGGNKVEGDTTGWKRPRSGPEIVCHNRNVFTISSKKV